MYSNYSIRTHKEVLEHTANGSFLCDGGIEVAVQLNATQAEPKVTGRVLAELSQSEVATRCRVRHTEVAYTPLAKEVAKLL